MPRKRNTKRPGRNSTRSTAPSPETDVRIIGGEFRGRRLRYHGDPSVRPMKHRVREAIFNLVGLEAAGRRAIDLFAGTGALGLEAISRGAAHATLIEKHVPTARIVEENIRLLGCEQQAALLVTSAFLWGKRELQGKSRVSRVESQEPGSELDSGLSIHGLPWLVFCSPPYAFYVDRQNDVLDLIRTVQKRAPRGSVLVIEADERLDFGLIGNELDVREYPPAVVGVWRKP